MSFFKSISLSPFCFMILTLTSIHAAVFEIQNNCSYTVWAAANPGGGRELHQGQSLIINTDPNFRDIGRIWARTNCDYGTSSTIKCETGDCGGALYCDSNGALPVTLAEYAFNQSNNNDLFDISVVDGFNVPMEFKGSSSGCKKVIKCTGDINGLCPTELRHPGGCNNACSVFKNDQFCCINSNGTRDTCSPTAYSRFFKNLCPNAYTYPYDDDATALFTCPTGSNYKVVFCP